MHISSALALTILFTSTCAARAETRIDQELFDWLIAEARTTEFESMRHHLAAYILCDMTKNIASLGDNDLAIEFWQKAFKITTNGPLTSAYQRVFETAVTLDRLDMAKQVIPVDGRMRDSLLDKMDIEKYRRGDKQALANFPRGRDKLTFYDAMHLAQLYLDLGDFKSAEELVTDLEITEENEPEDVAALTFKDMARRCLDNGDIEQAKKYADKAFEVGGGLYYTGYAIQVFHRSVHGTLTEDLDKFAQRGAAYGGHQGRELVSGLIRELYHTHHFDEAKQVMKYLDDEEDVLLSMGMIVVEQAKMGDVAAALKTIEELKESPQRDYARTEIARAFWRTGKKDAAAKLATFLHRRLENYQEEDANRQSLGLAHLYGLLHDKSGIERLLTSTDDAWQRARRLSEAINGFVESCGEK